jgi:DNA-binding MarR family transcriptional regulator
MNRKSGAARSPSTQGFTEKHGQYHMFRRPPAETDMQRHFQVSPPSVHQMIVTLERNGLIRRQPGVARSIQILVPPKDLPILNWLGINQS